MRIGALFAGYGGLELGLERVLPDTSLAWYAEVDPFANRIMAHRHPTVPNLGDVTAVDWSDVPRVDVLTGGSPCQDLSHAGRRQGMTEGTRSNLWVAMREAIAQLRPRLVVWENVRGALSAPADSAVEPCPGCVGDRPGVSLRALGRVVGDLSELGYVGQWHGLRAADVGAPHARWRVFLGAAADPGCFTGEVSVAGQQPTVSLAASNGHSGGIVLLPTPAVNDMGEGKTVGAWDEWTATMKAKHANGNGHGPSLSIEAQRLLTPKVEHEEGRWGQYADAINRWELLTRPAPPPTEHSAKGTPQLSPVFVEWMMGLPAGWVTDVPGMTRNGALKALGNGVVPQQAMAALTMMGVSG